MLVNAHGVGALLKYKAPQLHLKRVLIFSNAALLGHYPTQCPQPEVISLCFKKNPGTMVPVRCLKKSKINRSSNAG
jgi:hypothetical protein